MAPMRFSPWLAEPWLLLLAPAGALAAFRRSRVLLETRRKMFASSSTHCCALSWEIDPSADFATQISSTALRTAFLETLRAENAPGSIILLFRFELSITRN